MNARGAVLPTEEGLEPAVIEWLREALNRGVFDAVLIPVETPAEDSFAYLLVQNPAILDRASPLPPVMPVQGGKAIGRLTLRGALNKRVAAVVRPCEARAAIELTKLKQAHLTNLSLITLDCPGVLPLADYLEDPAAGAARFAEAAVEGDRSPMRPTCQICHRVSLAQAPGADLHIGTLGTGDDAAVIVAGSLEGERILGQMGTPEDDQRADAVTKMLERWTTQVEEVVEAQTERRRQAHAELQEAVAGAERLLDTFSTCINCHNCQRVCPVCYCRQCYFESTALKLPPENYLARAASKGALRFAPDTLLFHIGRASHMALSCVSCGACEDACPMDIPVGQVFSLLADRAQEALGYVAGRSVEDPLPLVAYEMEELHDVEQPYVEIYCEQEVRDA
ncbi:MAG: 4Fe-4S dicluster domain-containing protein [Chloroflexota bacterium]